MIYLQNANEGKAGFNNQILPYTLFIACDRNDSAKQIYNSRLTMGLPDALSAGLI